MDGFLAEIMVDAEDLFFVGVTGEIGVEFLSRFEVVAERFLDNDALPMRAGLFAMEEFGVVEMFDDFGELAGRRGEIEEEIVAELGVAESVEIGGKLFVGVAIGEITAGVMKIFGEVLPGAFVDGFGAGELVEGGAEFGAPLVVGFLATRETDDAEGVWERFLDEEMVERGDEFAGSEVAAGAEDDDGARVYDFARLAEAAGH